MLRLNVCNKEVNNVTMNNLFVMQCQFHIVTQCSSYIVSAQPDKVWQFCKSYDNKKRQVPTINSFNLDMYYETLFPREVKG